MKKLLFTNNIDEKYVKELSEFTVEEVPFIEVKKVSIDYELDIEVQFPVIISSQNAIWAVNELRLVNSPLYVVGNTTAQKLKDKGYTVVEVGENAEDLVNKLPNSDAYYLCGNIRHDVIPEHYENSPYTLYEVPVYETEMIANKVSGHFDGISFMSPSAVRAFYEQNSIPEDTTIFAIGDTTASEIANFTKQNVISPDESTLPSLVSKINEVLG